jgi:XFP N-terminal domain
MSITLEDAAADQRKMHALEEQDSRRIDAYWRAANYLSVGQIYLLDNPLLREPLRLEHIKQRLLGHWGTSPGLSSETKCNTPADLIIGTADQDLRECCHAEVDGLARTLPQQAAERALLAASRRRSLSTAQAA